MKVGSIIRQIRSPDRLYLITEEMDRYWVLSPLGSAGGPEILAKTTKGFEVIG
jgi:hypothetical protein